MAIAGGVVGLLLGIAYVAIYVHFYGPGGGENAQLVAIMGPLCVAIPTVVGGYVGLCVGLWPRRRT
jgi:hypothetical protein